MAQISGWRLSRGVNHEKNFLDLCKKSAKNRQKNGQIEKSGKFKKLDKNLKSEKIVLPPRVCMTSVRNQTQRSGRFRKEFPISTRLANRRNKIPPMNSTFTPSRPDSERQKIVFLELVLFCFIEGILGSLLLLFGILKVVGRINVPSLSSLSKY